MWLASVSDNIPQWIFRSPKVSFMFLFLFLQWWAPLRFDETAQSVLLMYHQPPNILWVQCLLTLSRVPNGEPLWSLRESLTVAHSNRNDKTPIIITIIVIKYNDNDDDDDDDNDDNTLYCKFDLHWKLWLAERIQSIYKIVWSNRITQYLQHILHLSTRVQSLPGFQAP